MRSVLYLLGLVSIAMLTGSSVSAQQETQLVVAPAIIDAPAVVGKSTERTIQIGNKNKFALPITIEVQSAVIDGEPLDRRTNDRYDVSDWVSFEEETYVFEAGETRQIPFTITAPFTALPGGHYAQISIRGLALESSSGQQGIVFPEIGVPLLVTVPGEIVEDVRVQDVSIFPRFATPGRPIELVVPVENVGTVHNLVRAKVIIEQDEKIVSEIDLSPSVVLPETRKEFKGVWQPDNYGYFNAYVELAFGSASQKYQTSKEQVIVTPPIGYLLLLAFSVWACAYVWPRRKNIVGALQTLFARG